MNLLKKTKSKAPAFNTTQGGRYKPTVGDVATKHAVNVQADKIVRSWFGNESKPKGIKLKKK